MPYSFDIPEIPWERVAESKLRVRKVWNLQDLNLQDPVLNISWKRPPDPSAPTAAQRIRDPEIDVRSQLNAIRCDIEHLEAGKDVGHPIGGNPHFNLVHFGTGPLATAFGSKWIVRENDQPFFEPAVHTPEEVMNLRKPDLYRDGILPLILERIQYYNEATQGKIPLTPCDTAGPWSIATQIWHYEDMLEAIYTAPEAVHYLLDLVTDCIIEWFNIQESCIRNWGGTHISFSWPWYQRGIGIGDDCMVNVSPKTWEEFFLPYNDRMAHEYGGVCYHCCLCYENHLMNLTKSYNFMGFDADPQYNNFDKIEAALVAGKGVWTRPVGGSYMGVTAAKALEEQLFYINRLKGKVGMFLGVEGETRQAAVDNAKRLLDSI